jgi:hypothetical protein
MHLAAVVGAKVVITILRARRWYGILEVLPAVRPLPTASSGRVADHEDAVRRLPCSSFSSQQPRCI